MNEAGESEPGAKPTRRDQAIANAADLLREGGPTALTSVAVAERMGVTQSAVYRHVRNMDELAELAAESVVAELTRSLRDILVDPDTDWEDLGDIGRLCRDLVDSMIRNQRSFEVIANWRFVDGALGTGIRKVIGETCDLVALLLEARWRIEFGGEEPLTERDMAALRAHARAIHDDAHAVAHCASSPPPPPRRRAWTPTTWPGSSSIASSPVGCRS